MLENSHVEIAADSAKLEGFLVACLNCICRRALCVETLSNHFKRTTGAKPVQAWLGAERAHLLRRWEH
jgi:hypothetical protein